MRVAIYNATVSGRSIVAEQLVSLKVHGVGALILYSSDRAFLHIHAFVSMGSLLTPLPSPPPAYV